MPTPFQQRATERRAKIVAEVEAAKKTLEDATTVGAGFWVSYIFLMFYIAVSAGAVSHVDLFMENPVKLPFLNLDLPLLGFFFLAPILFIIMHIFTLSKLVMLAEKAKRFLEALQKLPTPEAREKLRRALPSNIFTQFMAGPTELSGGAFGVLLRMMGWITMALAPVLLLLFLQVQFLPYHSFWLTWEHRAALLVDLLLLWWLWRRALQTSTQATTCDPVAPAEPRERAKEPLTREGRFFAPLLGLALSAAALFASLVATYPTEWKTSPLAFAPLLEAHRAALTEAVFREKPSCTRGDKILEPVTEFDVNRPFPCWPTNTLQLEEFNIFEFLKLEDHDKLGGRNFTVQLQSRRLEGANLTRAKLGKADLREAKLNGAELYDAELQGAELDHAELQRASITHAKLQGSSLRDALLQGAELDYAELQGAALDHAELRGATLFSAKLQGTVLRGATLQGASLDSAKLQGAELEDAELQGTTFNNAELQATSLYGAIVWHTVFDGTAFSTLGPGLPVWGPRTRNANYFFRQWTQADYENLKRDLIAVIPEGYARQKALERIERLSCSGAKEKEGCPDNLSTGEEATLKQMLVTIKGTTIAAYAAALTAQLKAIVCAPDENAIYSLRGVIRRSLLIEETRFADTAANAPRVVDEILSPKTYSECPVSPALTSADRARLLDIKKWALTKYPPQPAPTENATKQ